jgi:ferritin-like metal-binding protein YciE
MATKAEEKNSGESKSGDSKSKKNSLKDIFETELKDILSAEKQLVAALPEMAKAADSETLEDAITEHLRQTQKHVERLNKVFERIGIPATEQEKCKAMEGLIEEGKKIIREFERSPVRDSALIIGAQKIEHYEIAAYGSLCELAEVLGEQKIADILDRTLEEEEETDRLLTQIAQEVNDEASEVMA